MENLKRMLTGLLLSTVLAGCAALNELVTATPTGHASLKSGPPEAPVESVPTLASDQVWVPGYYEPVAEAWVWHRGTVVLQRDGYRLVPASYPVVDGRVSFRPPAWHRSGSTTASVSSIVRR